MSDQSKSGDIPMKCYTLSTEPPTLYCPDTSRVIAELFWGGWTCYDVWLEGKSNDMRITGTLHGNRVGVCECYSHAQNWLFGRDAEANILTLVSEPPNTSDGDSTKDKIAL